MIEPLTANGARGLKLSQSGDKRLQGSRFTDIMPENLASQLETQAFAYALGRQIEKLCAYADGIQIYVAVATMPERILDVLAIELRTPAYNQKFSIEVKWALVEGTLSFYAHLGTPAACNRIIKTIFGSGNIEEWFDYDGEPHHFRAYVGNGRVDLKDLAEFRRVLGYVKRLSSWLDEIIITLPEIHGKVPVSVKMAHRIGRSAPPRYRAQLAARRVPAALGLGMRYSTITLPMAAGRLLDGCWASPNGLPMVAYEEVKSDGI